VPLHHRELAPFWLPDKVLKRGRGYPVERLAWVPVVPPGMKPLVSMPSGILRASPVRFLAALLLAGAGPLAVRAVADAGAATGDCASSAAWPAAHPGVAAAALSAVNAHRVARGLAPLAVSESLTASATWKARHMAAYNYMAHDDPAPPVARSLFDRAAACGYGGPVGENIARWYPTAAAVVQAWLADPPHRANIEGAWSTTGIAVAVSNTGLPYWVEDFGTGQGSPPPPSTTTAKPSPRRCVVPRVAALRTQVAKARLRKAGCGVQTIRVRAPDVGVGRVAWQSPRRGVRLRLGSPVTIAVSTRR